LATNQRLEIRRQVGLKNPMFGNTMLLNLLRTIFPSVLALHRFPVN